MPSPLYLIILAIIVILFIVGIKTKSKILSGLAGLATGIFLAETVFKLNRFVFDFIFVALIIIASVILIFRKVKR